MRLWLYHLVRWSPLAGTLAGLVWIWLANPFVAPVVARTGAELRLALDRALARHVDDHWLAHELSAAVAAGDLDRAQMLLAVGADQVPPVLPPEALAAEVAALARRVEARAAADCLVCMVEAETCRSLTHIGLCLVPFELTPMGDLNALRQEGWALAQGDPVDEVNAGLALIGLGASAAVVATGGSSVSAKAGATALRVARRLGSVTPRFGADLADMARLNFNAGGLIRHSLGRAPLEAALDTGRLARLQGVGADLTRVAEATSVPDTLLLLRHVETAEDTARLARVSAALGPDTRKYFEVLGGPRVFARAVRLTDAALAAALILYGAVLQLVLPLASWAGRRAARALARRLRPS